MPDSNTTHGHTGAGWGRWPVALLATVMLTWCVFGQTVAFDFVGFDDEDYVSHNPWVTGGFSRSAIRWALLAYHSGNWHPLTWLSHMLDCQLFGTWAGGHHLGNVALHSGSVVLLAVALFRMTGRAAPSVAAAALFAVHPLRAESVAWVSERKDCLSLFLGLGALCLYARYVERPTVGRYLAVVLTFGLGLTAKPLLVTLPCVLWLLDYWPLGRFGFAPGGTAARARLPRLVAEKIPLLALVVLSSWWTIGAQRAGGAMSSLATFPWPSRLAQAVIAYPTYLALTVWPHNLAFVYPRSAVDPSRMAVIASVLGLVLATVVCWVLRRSRPYLLVGWLWFLGTLVPNIGLVQVGPQWLADRFTYLSGIGLALCVCWAGVDLVGTSPMRGRLAMLATAAATLLLAGLCYRQVGTWRNTESMVANALAVDPTNYIAHRVWGSTLADAGKYAEAIPHYEQATEIRGRVAADTLVLLSTALIEVGRMDDARAAIDRARAARDDVADVHRALGKLELRGGHPVEAEAAFRQALARDQNFAQAHNDLAVALSEQNRWNEALQHARQAVQLRPRDGELLGNLALAEAHAGTPAAAISTGQAAVRFALDRARAQYSLGYALAAAGQLHEAEQVFRDCLVTRANYSQARYDLARLEMDSGRASAAAHDLAIVVQEQPGWLGPANDLAWILATHPDPETRDGAAAVALAERAVASLPDAMPELLDTLAAAYAEAGQWEQAAATAERGRVLADRQAKADLAQQMARRLELYRARRPYRAP